MADYLITDTKLHYIAEQFHVKLESVRLVHKIFVDVISGVKNQYLAHIIRSMELYIRKKTSNPMFQINCFPINPESPVLSVGCAQYFPKRCFAIFFHPRMDDKQLRVCLAHELGHLFIIELLNEGAAPQTYDPKTMTEPLSSIFGIFTIMDKNNFYQDCAELFNHDSWQSIVTSFINLQHKAGF
jgi:hypothetical protein